MTVKANLFPGGVRRALTMSYDDGQIFDVRLAELFDKYHIRGTFHINSGNLGGDKYVKKEDFARVYRNHEVSVHTVTHPFPTQIPDTALLKEILEDKQTLEELCGYPVRGMSYPSGIIRNMLLRLLETAAWNTAGPWRLQAASPFRRIL